MTNKQLNNVGTSIITAEYLVFAEFDNIGYLINIYNSQEEAKIIMNKIWELGNPPTPFSLNDLNAFFSLLEYQWYEIKNESSKYMRKSEVSKSNGLFCVGIVKS